MIVSFEGNCLTSGTDGEKEDAYRYAYIANQDKSQYLGFQRSVSFEEDGQVFDDDPGIYVEVNDQGSSGYECIASCKISDYGIEVVLSEPLGQRRDVQGIHIAFASEVRPSPEFIQHLREIFREREWLLAVGS